MVGSTDFLEMEAFMPLSPCVLMTEFIKEDSPFAEPVPLPGL